MDTNKAGENSFALGDLKNRALFRFSRASEVGEQTVLDSAITDLDSSSLLVSPAGPAACGRHGPAHSEGAASVCSLQSLRRRQSASASPSAASAFMREATRNLKEMEDQVR